MKTAFLQQWIDKFSKMRQRQRQTILITAIGVISLVLIAGAMFTIISNKQFSTFESSSAQVSISYPSKWEVRKNVPGAVVGFVAPKQSVLDVFQSNVSIVTQDLTGRAISLKAYGQEAEMQMKGFFKGAIAVEYSGQAYVAGMDAYKLIYRGINETNPSLNLKAEHIMFLKNETAYQVTYTALESKFDKYADAFEKMAASFRIK